MHEKYDYPDDSTLTYHAVHAGMGVAFLPEWTVGDDLAAGRLALVLPAYTLPPLTLYAVYMSRQYMTPKLRTFIDFFSSVRRLAGSGLLDGHRIHEPRLL